MKPSEYCKLDALAIAELVAKGDVTPSEALDAALTMADKTQQTINAIAHIDSEIGNRNALNATSGVFRGVPFLVKELLSYPGLKTPMGSRLFAMNIASNGSEYTNKIDASGLVTFGNTTSSEFGLLGSTETLLNGVTHNPWNRSYSAAGSSGGSAAAVAAGIVPMAHASDGGGSVRIPASVCGLFGFKPSAGRCVPATEFDGPFVRLVSEHCISKTVRDSAAFLSITEDTGAPNRQPKYKPIGFVANAKKQRLRIGVYTQPLMGNVVDADVVKAIEKTQTLCEQLGHEIIPINAPPIDGRALSDGFFTVAGLAMDQMTQFVESLMQRKITNDDIEPFTYELIQWFRTLQPDAAQTAMNNLQRAADTMLQFAKGYDVLLCPTLTSEPKKLGFLAPNLPMRELITRTEQYVGYTPIHNIAGMCAMSVPLFESKNGLPIGSHFAAAPGNDATLFQLAYQLEEAAPWVDRIPTINQHRHAP